MIVAPKNFRTLAHDELARAREMDAGAWPRSDVENAFARAQFYALLAIEEQVERLRLGVATVGALVALLALVVAVL